MSLSIFSPFVYNIFSEVYGSAILSKFNWPCFSLVMDFLLSEPLSAPATKVRVLEVVEENLIVKFIRFYE